MNADEKARRRAARNAARRAADKTGVAKMDEAIATAVDSLAIVEGVPEMSVSSLQSAGVKMEVTKEDLLAILMEDALDKLRDQHGVLQKRLGQKRKEYSALPGISLVDFHKVNAFVEWFGAEYGCGPRNKGAYGAASSTELAGTKDDVRIVLAVDVFGVTPQQRDVNAEVEALCVEINNLDDKIRFIERNPAKFRARVSKMMLSATSEGRKIVSALQMVRMGDSK